MFNIIDTLILPVMFYRQPFSPIIQTIQIRVIIINNSYFTYKSYLGHLWSVWESTEAGMST